MPETLHLVSLVVSEAPSMAFRCNDTNHHCVMGGKSSHLFSSAIDKRVVRQRGGGEKGGDIKGGIAKEV